MLDLLPELNEKKHARAKHLADQWTDKIMDKLATETKGVARKNFQNWVGQGNKLSYNNLRRLNSVWKKDYVESILNESDMVQSYTGQVVNELKENK